MRHEALTIATSLPAGLPRSGAEPGLLPGCPDLVGTSFTYGREEEIFGEGEEADFVYRVVRGAVRTCKVLSDGRRQIDAFHLAGDLFGFENGGTHRLSAEAIVPTTVLLFRRRQIEEAAGREVAAARQLWNHTLRSLGHAQDHMILLGRRTALERVAAFVLLMEARLGGTGRFELAMPRRDIADYLGLTLETVSRAMSQLQSEGAIALSGARRLTVDKRRLNALVED
ncbi:helix-turn-helix domain-containing protein [Aquabacter spiritensis]|uniref:CRP/FNR family nitrogen fixation transcriptional regulator n=1 Tax=Aquabacter spiritensis TaxID=933073 RepID=A0A4R3LZK2_9HYPH|nr:helix-turn-helix domain-containing protein [Aquabacter spiritensis]TCT06191.1 CRP/FNR family nitrogen fixation transcriptional regulator [Aquabacter spiritensis]